MNNDNLNGISDFIKELWQAAVNMRGSIERFRERKLRPVSSLRYEAMSYGGRQPRQ
jgi:hypothetical protein